MPPNGTTGKSSSKTTGKSNTKSNNKSNAGSSNRNAGPGGGMMGGRGSGGPSRTAPSRSVSSKMGSKSSQSGVSKAQSTTSRIGGPASANRAQANKTFDRGIAGVPGGSNRLGGSLAQKAKSPSLSSLADKGIAGVPGGVNRTGKPLANKEKSTWERFQERYPRGLKDMNVLSISPPIPGGFGPAGNVVRTGAAAARSGLEKVAGQFFGAGKRAAEIEKRIADLKRMQPELERLALSERVKRGLPATSTKIPDKLPPMKLSQIREANKPIRGFDTWNRIENAIDKVTEAAGFGTGPMARTKASAAGAGSLWSGVEIGDRLTSDYRRGGLVKKPKKSPPKKKR